MIGDFIRRGQRGRAVSIEGLTSHRTPKNLCERDALPTELYPRNVFARQSLTCEFRIRIRIVGPPVLPPLMIFGESTSVQKSHRLISPETGAPRMLATGKPVGNRAIACACSFWRNQ